MYYADKLESLKDIFGFQEICLESDRLSINGHIYPIIDDVIILLDPAQYTPSLQNRIEGMSQETGDITDFAEDIQFTFGEEWQKFPEILPAQTHRGH